MRCKMLQLLIDTVIVTKFCTQTQHSSLKLIFYLWKVIFFDSELPSFEQKLSVVLKCRSLKNRGLKRLKNGSDWIQLWR
jgi:hypothetical protein